MRTSALRRCATHSPSIGRCGQGFRVGRPPARGARAAEAVAVATHQSESLVRVRDRVGLRTTRPRPLGSLPDQQSVPEGGRAPLRGGGARALRPAGRRALPYRRARPGRARHRLAFGLPARDCWMGETLRRREGWGCPAPSSPVPIEAWPRGGSLPSTFKERGSASALRWPWHNQKLASDLYGRGRVRPNGDFVSGHPQSVPDNSGSASGASKTASE